jgi:signal transduction histidine kinase
VSALAVEPDVEARWRRWLVERNRRGLRIGLIIMLTGYPAFGVLDWLLAPAGAVGWFWAMRALVTVVTAALLLGLRSEWVGRHIEAIGGAYTWLGSAGVSVMTLYIGGLESPYYAGLSLIILSADLLLVWRPQVVALTHGAVVATFVALNLWAIPVERLGTAISNLTFLSTTALVAGIGHVLTYRTHRDQVAQRVRLEQTTAHLERAHADLQRLDQFKSRFFANMTHELRTPLAMVLTPLELMLQGEMGEFTASQRSSFASMYRSALKLLKLINDLLDLSRLEESRLPLEIGEHELVAYLKALVEQSEILARRRGIALTFAPSVERVTVRCDLDRLERVFVNLLSNAIKFTPARGHVEVALAEVDESVRVVVQDDGPGFPPEKADQLFERFYQVDMEGTRRHGGTGIGLALARELVLLHGGTIAAFSDGRRGARFVVTLPRDHAFGPEAHVAPDTSPATQDWSVQLERRGAFRLLDIEEATDRRVVERDPDEERRPHTVLVVEDNPQVVQIVHMSLRRDFKVRTAPDGEKALEMVLREQPSLVVTDLMMPGMDGLELTRRLRADARTRHIPILMLTARSAVDDRVAGLDTGVSAYLTKPFSPRELVTCARQLVKAEEQTADLVLTRRMESVEIVAAGLAHEINNPLNYLKNALARVKLDAERVHALAGRAAAAPLGAADTAELERAGARMEDMLGVAASGIARIARTVEMMSRYGRGGFRRELVPVDPWETVRTVVGVVLPATGRAVEVDLDLHGDATLECVPDELSQVLTNLVQNAIEAAPESGGRVSVRGAVDGEQVVFSVSDNGPGVPAEVQARLFTPFFTTKGPGRGMGLGLTIARRVVQSLGGTLTLSSAPGAGAEFVVRLPRRQAAATPERRGAVSPVA